MNMKPRKQLPQNQQATVEVDLKDAETLKCEHCKNYLFIESYVLKRLSPIVSPTAKEELIPVQVYSCGNCGRVPRLYSSVLGNDVESNLEKTDKPRENFSWL